MFLSAAKQGVALLNNMEKPHTAVTAWIDMLCTAKYEEDDYEGIPELVESINLQSTGPTEASRAVRKKLKYSNTHGQLRALTILKALVENGGTRFQTTFANERLVDRIKIMAADPMTDERVKKKIMIVLASWHRQFKDDPRMSLVAGLYQACGGGRSVKAAPPSRTQATEAYETQMARYEREAAERAERKARLKQERKEAERLAKERAKQSKNKSQQQQPRKKFNFELEKPNIMARVGSATQSAQALINALQLVNREKESVTTNERVQTCLAKVKTDRKYVVRYIQLVDNDSEGEFIGMLIHTNEQILSALALYDRMSKPTDLDSDDEEVQKAKDASRAAGLNVADDADTQSIRSRLSAFEMGDNEVDKLQRRQRERVEAAKYRRQQSAAVHPDLQDLAFGSSAQAGSSLPAPIAPRSADDTYRHGSLSDFSDYDEEDEEDIYSSSDGEIVEGRLPPTSASSSTGSALPNVNARSYAQYVQSGPGDAHGRAGAQQHASLLRSGESFGDDDDAEDPFGDENEAENAAYEQVVTPGINEKKRMEWAAV